jgi:hypothetical protein
VLAGNRFPRLANRARALMLLLDRPFDELDLLVLQLHICADFSMCNGSGSLVLAPPS